MTEDLIHFAQAKQKSGFRTTKSLVSACQRHGIPIVRFNRRVFALKPSDYELLLRRASGTETV